MYQKNMLLGSITNLFCPLTSHIGRSILAKGIQCVWGRFFDIKQSQRNAIRDLNMLKYKMMSRPAFVCHCIKVFEHVSAEPRPLWGLLQYSVSAKGRPIQTGEVTSSYRVVFLFSTKQHLAEVYLGSWRSTPLNFHIIAVDDWLLLPSADLSSIYWC